MEGGQALLNHENSCSSMPLKSASSLFPFLLSYSGPVAPLRGRLPSPPPPTLFTGLDSFPSLFGCFIALVEICLCLL